MRIVSTTRYISWIFKAKTLVISLIHMPSDSNDPTRLNKKTSWIERNQYHLDDLVKLFRKLLYISF